MDKKAAIMRSLGPMEDYGLEKDDPTFGMNQPSLEGDIHSPNPGPDRPKPELQEQTVESYGDDVPDYMADILRQLELTRNNVGEVVVHKAPLRMAAEEKVKDTTYSRIIAAMKRIAADEEKKSSEEEEKEKESKPAPEAADEKYMESSAPAPAPDTAEQLAAEQERLRQQQEDDLAAERAKRDKEIEEQLGNPREQTRQEGPRESVTSVISIQPGEPGYDALAAVSEQIFESMKKQVELMDRYITESEFIFRWNRALRDSFKAARDINSKFYKQHKAAIEKVAPVLDKILSADPGLKKVQVGGNAGTASRTKSVRNLLNGVKLEDIMSVVLNPGALAEAVAGLKSRTDIASEGPKRAAELEKLVKNNGPKLKEALQKAMKLVEESAKSTMDTKSKLSGLSARFAPSAKGMMENYRKVLERAEKYNQDISDIASKYKVSDEELAEEKNKLQAAIQRLQSAMSAAEGLSSAAEGSSKAASNDSVVRYAKSGSWAEAVSEVDEIYFESEKAMEDVGAVDNISSILAAIPAAAESMEGMSAAMEAIEPIASAFSSASAQAPSQAAEPAKESAAAPADKSESNPPWYEQLMQSLSPSQPQFAGAMAASDVDIIRKAIKEKKEKKSSEPAGFSELSTDKPLPPTEELKKPFLSPGELSKAELPAERAKDAERIKREREDKARAKPSSEAKRAKVILQKAADALAAKGLTKEQMNEFVDTRHKSSEASKQLREGLEAGRDAMRAAEEEAKSYKEQRAQEEGGEEILSHKERLTDVERQMAAEADKILSLNEQFATALRSIDPAIDSAVGSAVVILGDAYQWLLDMSQKEAILEHPDMAKKMEAATSLVLKNLKSKYKSDLVAKEEVALLADVAKLMSNVAVKFGSRSSMRHTAPEVEYVQKEIGPAIEKGVEKIKELAPEVAEPLRSEQPEPQAPGQEAQAAADFRISRNAEDSDAEDKALLAEMKELAGMLPKATKEAEAIGEMADSLVAMAESSKDAIEELKAMSSEAPAEESTEEDGMSWDKVREMGRGLLDRIREGLTPAAPEMSPAMATAAKSDILERAAGDYDNFDQSKNRLEIVEGEDGKRRLVMNRGLKSFVARKVHEQVCGGYKCGDSVQVDMSDYLGAGVVKAYLGNAVYRVEVDGAVMEVPAKNIYGLSSPWR